MLLQVHARTVVGAATRHAQQLGLDTELQPAGGLAGPFASDGSNSCAQQQLAAHPEVAAGAQVACLSSEDIDARLQVCNRLTVYWTGQGHQNIAGVLACCRAA